MTEFYPAPPVDMVSTADGEQAVIDFFVAKQWRAATEPGGDTVLFGPDTLGNDAYGIWAYPVPALMRWGWLYEEYHDYHRVIRFTADANGRPYGHLPVPS